MRAAAEVLRALGHPVSFVLLVVSFLIAVTAHGWVQSLAADRAGDRRPRMEGRRSPDPRRHVDPFGAVAGLIAGMGWSKPLEPPPRQRRGQLLAVTLSGPAVNLLLALGALVLFRGLIGAAPASSTLLQEGIEGDFAPRAALLFGLMNLYVGLLSLVPLPPLDGGRLLFGLGPRSVGWQKAEYHLVEQNIGIVAVLVLLLLPLGGPQALLPLILDEIAEPIVRLVTGG
jgi:Zn-dependent protease